MNSIRINKNAAISLDRLDGAKLINRSNELLNLNEEYDNFIFNSNNHKSHVFDKLEEISQNKIEEIQLEHWEISDVSMIIYPGIDGIIISNNNQFLKEQIKYFRPKIFNKFVFDLINSNYIQKHHIDKEVFCGFDCAWRNYYHFLVLTLPKYFLNTKYLKNTVPILPDLNNKIEGNETIPSFSQDTFQSIINMSPITLDSITFLKPGIYNFKKIHFFKQTGAELHNVYTCNFQKFYSRFKLNKTDLFKNEKIFLSRKNSRNKRPIDAIEPNLEDNLLKKGYKVVCPDELAFKDQVDLFNNADQISGLHGAAFTNILFNQNKNVSIHEISSLVGNEKGLRPHFFNLAKLKNLEYKCSFRRIPLKS